MMTVPQVAIRPPTRTDRSNGGRADRPSGRGGVGTPCSARYTVRPPAGRADPAADRVAYLIAVAERP